MSTEKLMDVLGRLTFEEGEFSKDETLKKLYNCISNESK